jgi:hypothetical protein
MLIIASTTSSRTAGAVKFIKFSFIHVGGEGKFRFLDTQDDALFDDEENGDITNVEAEPS